MQTYTYGMTSLVELRARRDQILELAARHHASNVRVVGSAARGDTHELSDVDLLVDMNHDRELHGFAYFGELDRLEKELGELLQCRVDIVDATGVNTNAQTLRSGARLRDNLLRDAVAL